MRVRVILSVLLLASLSAAQEEAKKDPVIEKVIELGRAENQVMDHLDHLTNKIGPRLTSSDKLTQACEWARDQFRAWGLKAEMEEWGTFPVGYNRRKWSGQMLAPEKKELTFGFDAWTPGTKGPVAGPAVLAPTTEEALEALKGKLKGAWVFSSGRLTNREIADKVTAAYNEEGIAGMVRASAGDLIHTGGGYRINFDKLPTRVNVTLLAKQHKEITGLLKEGKEVQVEFDIDVEFKKGPIPLYNVIADIPGTEKPDEYVIVGGHIDSWDGATGTTDNGTGTVTTMEAARLLAKAGAKPKRTIRFMLWSGEEQGLLGSRAWIQKHKDLLPKISAVLVHDGGTNYVSGITATKDLRPIFDEVFKPVMTLNEKMPFKIRDVQRLPMGIGSDHDSFLQVGVPGFFWAQTGKQNYNHEHHTQYDTYSAAVKEYEEHTSMVAAIAAWNIANLADLLPRPQAAGGGNAPQPERRRRFGVQLGGDEGLEILEVIEGSPAEKAGMKAGDVLLKVGDTPVTDMQTLREAADKAPAKVKVTVLRDKKEVVLDVEFEK